MKTDMYRIKIVVKQLCHVDDDVECDGLQHNHHLHVISYNTLTMTPAHMFILTEQNRQTEGRKDSRHRQADRRTERQTDRHMDRQTDRETDIPNNRHTVSVVLVTIGACFPAER